MGKHSIKVIGSGCPTCKKLHQTAQKAVSECCPGVEVEYVADVAALLELDIMTSPALVIDGKVVLTGGGHGEEAVKKAVCAAVCGDGQKGTAAGTDEGCCGGAKPVVSAGTGGHGCSCGGQC